MSLRWPLWFTLAPVDAPFAEHALAQFELDTWIDAPAEAVLDIFASAGAQFTPLAVEVFSEGERLYDFFYFASFCHRVLEHRRGQRWVAALESTSLPVLRAMLQITEVEPERSGTRFRWRVYYDPRPWARPLDPLLRPVLRLWLAATMGSLRRLCESRDADRVAAWAATAGH